MMTTSTKIYVLDTSVLLSSPKAMFTFGKHEVVIPIVVLKELEAKRNDPDLGKAARDALRSLDLIFRDQDSDLGARTPDGGRIRVEVNHSDRSSLPEALRKDNSHDTRILVVAHALLKENKDVILVSKDLPMRIIATAVCKVPAEDYHGDLIKDSGYSGLIDMDVPKETIDKIYTDHKLEAGFFKNSLGADFDSIPINAGVILRAGQSSALAVKNSDGELCGIRDDLNAFDLRGRSAEQRIALAHLMNPDIGIVSLGGAAGTGKSVLAIAAALELVMEHKQGKRVLVFRPVQAVGGETIGFLPGTVEEKMDPYAAATRDALEAITSGNVVKEVLEHKLLEVLPLTFIRGRSFVDTIIIIDEAQNLDKNTLLSALSRTGERSRVFITHDVAQRDNLRVGRYDGVAAVVEKLKGQSLFAHVTLTRSERSPVAEMVTRLLDLE
jgi:PhoH-like ATPase